MADQPTQLDVLRTLVEAHDQPHPRSGGREAIMYFRHMGGSTLQHHALSKPPPSVDDALIEELAVGGLITIDYLQHSWRLTPTPEGRMVVEEHDRVEGAELVAEAEPILDALAAQAGADNPLGWPAVRPILDSLRVYWQRGGFSAHGIQIFPIWKVVPEEHAGIFAATLRSLINADYLARVGILGQRIEDRRGHASDLPAEVALTEKAHGVLDGWPGAAPEELVENILAVLAAAAAEEADPARKRRLERLAEAIKDLGISITSEVVAKVVTGGLN